MPCASRSHPASGDCDRDGWPGPRPTRPRPPPQSKFTIAIFWVRVSQKNVCQTQRFRFICEKPSLGERKQKKKKKKTQVDFSQPSNYAVYAPVILKSY